MNKILTYKFKKDFGEYLADVEHHTTKDGILILKFGDRGIAQLAEHDIIEIVEKRQFTKSDLMDYAQYVVNHSLAYTKEQILQDWLKQQEEK